MQGVRRYIVDFAFLVLMGKRSGTYDIMIAEIRT